MRLGAMFRFLLLLLISAAFAIPTTSRGASTSANLAITVTKAQAITGVSLSSSSFMGGAPSGTVVGTISVSMSPASPAFSGTLTLSGSNASSFQIAGTNLETSGVLPAGTYQVNIVATQAGASGSPFTAAETITGTSSQGGGDPTVGLIPPASDGYANWRVAGMKAIPLTASIATDGTLTVTYSPSQALGVGQIISGAGVPSGITITAAKNDPSSNLLTGAGGNGTYMLSCAGSCPTIGGEAMTATGIPNRGSVYTTLSACSPSLTNACDDTSAIQTALDNCPPGQVVQLNVGVFQVNGQGVTLRTACTLRGAGPGRQLNTGINPVDGGRNASISKGCGVQKNGSVLWLCVDAAATQVIKADRATQPSYAVFHMQNGNSSPNGTSYNLASDGIQGSYTVSISSATTPAISPGDIVWIDENSETDPNVYWGGLGAVTGGYNYDGRGWGFRAVGRSIIQMAEVQSVGGSAPTWTITLTTPLDYTYPAASPYSSQLTTFTQQPLHGAGFENLFIFGGRGADGQGGINVYACAYCWIKNVESDWNEGGINFKRAYKNELRDSFLHETDYPTPGGGGYLLAVDGGSSETLIENNISWYGNKEIVMRAAGGGNVIAYNYMDDAFDDGVSDGSPEAGVNTGHLATSHLELVEGNYSQNFKGDTYWGASIFTTVFRNQLSGLRAAWPPLNTYAVPAGCGAYGYGDYTNRKAVDVQGGTLYHNFIGNVLGFNGQTLLIGLGGSSCNEYGQNGWIQQFYSTAQSLPRYSNPVWMWYFGDYQDWTNNRNWSQNNTTINTMIRTANWDYVTGAETCYGAMGGTTNVGCSGTTVPNSFYLAAKPPFFGSSALSWPWVNPATGAASRPRTSTTAGDNILPAKYCFEHNMMPTCLQ
jgi:hypothetical protein